MSYMETGAAHVARLQHTVAALDHALIERWGKRLADILSAGGRMLAAGNGGSAAEAQHLTSELVGRLRDDRKPLSAIALHADSSSMTAIGNDYGYADVFARQVRAHGRRGDVLVLLSTSGRSENLLRAAEAARDAGGIVVWGMTGPVPNPLAALCDEVLAVPSASTATVQECHLVAIHLLCAEVDIRLGVSARQDVDWPCPAPIVVVGDALLDRDLVGEVRRLSPEAPVPVIDDLQTRARPGGAGLAAMLAARGSRPVVLITALSADDEGRELADLLRACDVKVIDLGADVPTTVKSRVRTGNRSLLMLSKATERLAVLRRSLTDRERGLLCGAAAVLVSDYGRGVTHDHSVRDALTAAVAHTPVVWDPHPSGASPVPGVRLVTPNSREAAHFAGGQGTGLEGDVDRAAALLDLWPVCGVVITRGADGAVLLESREDAPLVVPGTPVTALDTCGAGDQFAVAVTMGLADRAFASTAVTSAVVVSTEFVAAGGASALVGPESGAEPDAPAVRSTDATTLLARVRARGGTVVATGGCFDLIHAGHIAMLEQARRLGDCLLVCLNSDESVRRLKGETRPVMPEQDRAMVLASLSSVDAVMVFSQDTPEELLKVIRPDIWVKGGDYRVEDMPEAGLVARWGGRAVIVPYVDGRSTTNMIATIHGNRP
jgi:D-beta-D-heptose 7-phosphate kinase / D-beta-D-heptose 1-phosphate adenosyltransferase